MQGDFWNIQHQGGRLQSRRRQGLCLGVGGVLLQGEQCRRVLAWRREQGIFQLVWKLLLYASPAMGWLNEQRMLDFEEGLLVGSRFETVVIVEATECLSAKLVLVSVHEIATQGLVQEPFDEIMLGFEVLWFFCGLASAKVFSVAGKRVSVAHWSSSTHVSSLIKILCVLEVWGSM
ncbi:hypothetical protein L7F22_064736 [Adiantum nelumboides]|nr:hypothetical protein [Adiantum nelumboides]